MKKFIFLLAVCALFVTGCGTAKNQVVCTGKMTEDGVEISMKLTATIEDEKVSKVGAEMTVADEETAQALCGVFALMNQMVESEDDKISYECKGKTIKIKDYSSLADSEDEEESIVGTSKDDYIKAMEEENFTCK